MRHGACYGLGELLVALAEAGAPLSEAQAAGVANAVIEIEKARLYRGKGGEIMRAAACRLLECTAKAGRSAQHGGNPSYCLSYGGGGGGL